MEILEEKRKLYDNLAEWVIDYQRGDANAYEKIYQATLSHVAASIRTYNVPENDRSDLIQEIYITVFCKLPTLKDPQAFYKWLMTITSNKVMDYFRKNRKRLDMEVLEVETHGSSVGAEEWLYQEQDLAIDEMISVPENILDNRETQKILFSLMDEHLKPLEKKAIQLRCFGDRSIEQIAEELQVSRSTVIRMYKRALDKLNVAIQKMEKRDGIRIHSIGGISFIAGLFFVYASEQEVSAAEASAIYAGIQRQIASTVTTTSVSTGAAATGTMTKAVGFTLGKKIAIGIICALVVGGGAGVAAYHAWETNQVKEDQVEDVAEESAETAEVVDTEEVKTEEVVQEQEDVITDAVWETSSEEARKAFNEFLTDEGMVWHIWETALGEELGENTQEEPVMYRDFQPGDLEFIAADLNGVPMLLVYRENGSHHTLEKIFSYLNGQIQEVACSDSIQMYPNDGVFVLYCSGMGNYREQYYKMTSTGKEKVAEISENESVDGLEIKNAEYIINGKNCSKAELDDYVKELLKHSNIENQADRFLKNTGENRRNYFKIQDSENIIKDTVLADGTYVLRYTGQRSSDSFEQMDGVDMDFAWMKIGDNILQMKMDRGDGEEVYEIPLADDVKFVISSEDEWEVEADDYNRVFSEDNTEYGYLVEMTMQDGKVQKMLTTP